MVLEKFPKPVYFRNRHSTYYQPGLEIQELTLGQVRQGTAMKYMLLIYMTEDAMTDAERQACYVESTQLAQDLHAKGQYLAANPLHPVATATSVRIRGGETLVTDGPFAETREHLGGYFLIDAPNLDAALNIAARIPAAKKGTVEIRPVMEVPNLPEN